MLRRATPWLLLVFLVFAGCSRCGGDKPSGAKVLSPARYLPRSARAAVVIPDVGALGEKLARLQRLKIANFAAQLQNAQSAEGFVSGIMRQVGVDLRSAQAMEAAGLQPSRGAGLALLANNQVVSVLGMKDEKALTETFAKLARERLGAPTRAEEKVPGGTLVTFSRAGAPAPSLGLLLSDGYALVGAGELVAQLPGLATLAPEQSLAQEPLLSDALKRLPTERDFYAFLPGGLGFLLPVGGTESVTLVGSLREGALSLHADMPWPDEASFEVFKAQKGPDLAGYLPADSFLTVRYGGDPAKLEGVWPYLAGGAITRAVQSSGVDVKGELLSRLEPGMVAGVALAPTVQLGAGLPRLDPRRTNPFRFVHLVVVGEGKDAAGVASLLEKVPPLAQKLGAKVEPAELNGQRVYLTSYAQGEGTHLAAVDKKVLLAAPQTRLEAVLPTLSAPPGPSPVPEELRASLQEPVLGAVLDLRRLSDTVKALPSEAWGIGGFAIKATTVRFLEATDDLRAVTLGVSAKDKALRADLTLWLTPAAR